jgi:hypothetical protein
MSTEHTTQKQNTDPPLVHMEKSQVDHMLGHKTNVNQF